MADDRFWFEQKTFGYGAGLPIAWQGWVVVAAMLAGPIGLTQILLPAHPYYYGPAAIGWTMLWMPLMARRTRGGWKWRSGRE
jgi:hypothetical protein